MFQENAYLFKVCFSNCIFMSPPETIFPLHSDDDKYFKESFIIFPKCGKSMITQGGEVGLLKKVIRRRLFSSFLLFRLKFSISWMERPCESEYFEPEMLALAIMVLSVGSYNKDAVPPVNGREIEVNLQQCNRQSDSKRSNVMTDKAGTSGKIILLGTGNMEYKAFSLLLQGCGK